MPPLAASSGSFLITPGIGLMVWTLVVFAFEVGLVAALQAFIFATLTAIYLGGAVADHH